MPAHTCGRLSRLLFAALLVVAGGGGIAPATAQQSAPATRPVSTPGQAPRVAAESFRVGNNIYVRSLAVDAADDALWVGTSTGVLEIDLASRKVRNVFTREHGLANEYVFAIFVDRQGYKWFGTNAGGASRYRDGDWRVFFPMHGLADYWVYAFAEQASGPIWIGTWAGANRVDPKTLSFETYLEELVNEWVYAIEVDSRDRVWFGTEGGVSMYDGARWRHWTHADGLGAPNRAGLPSSANTGLGTRDRHDLNVQIQGNQTYNPGYVFALHIDPDDTVWAGTWGGGVARFDGERWENLTQAQGVAGNIVYSIERDRHGVYWFGTNRGLSRYDGREFRRYGHAQGLLGEDVYAIAATEKSLWVGTRGGVSRFDN